MGTWAQNRSINNFYSTKNLQTGSIQDLIFWLKNANIHTFVSGPVRFVLLPCPLLLHVLIITVCQPKHPSKTSDLYTENLCSDFSFLLIS